MPELKTVGLLAGTIAVKVGLYRKALERIGVTVLTPETEEEQGKVNDSIFEIKGSKKNKEVRQFLRSVAEKMVKRGAHAIILGCTELPVVIQQGDISVPIIDANQVLVGAAIQMAKGHVL